MSTLHVETLDTTRLPAADRWPFWLDVATRTSAPIALDSDHAADFRATAHIIDLGGIELTRFRYQSLVGQRTPRLIRQADPELYQIALTLAGASAISARRRDTALRNGDFTLVDWGHPHEIVHASTRGGQEQAASITVGFPRALLPLDSDRVDRLSAARMPGTTGPGALLAQHLHQLTRHPGQFRSVDAPQLADVTLSLVCTLLARHLDVENELPVDVRQRVMLARIRDFVEQQLFDAALSPQVVADAHHISVRTLHRLFETGDETVAGLIRRRRLERCRRDLGDPLLRNQDVQMVARRWGFTDKAHFSRAFRAAYGMSPQEYRARHPAPASTNAGAGA